jgi:hypothetical protein
MTDAVLKVLPAKYWNGDVVIIGNREGLEALKRTVELALTNDNGSSLVTEADGNQYFVCVNQLNSDTFSDDWQKLPLHYDEDDTKLTNEEEEQLYKFMNEK